MFERLPAESSAATTGDRLGVVRGPRRGVVIGTLVVGAALLAWGLTAPKDSASFYVATFSLAAVWIVGSLLAEPLRAGDAPSRWALRGLAVGVGLAMLFVAGAFVVNQIDALASRVDSVLDYARHGSLPLVVATTAVNGVAEEMFFRGPLFSTLPVRWQILGSTAIYAVVTMATGNVMLGFAAVLLGVVCALLRRRSGGVVGPIVTHVVWGLAMLGVLPLVIG